MKTIKPLRKLPLYLAVASATAATQTLVAQEADSSATTLEEVVVSARKRSESLQEVPIAISAFSGDAIKKAGIANIAGISNRTPGFQLDMANEGEPELFMRGIGSDFESAGGNNAIGVYVDEVYLSRGVGAISDLTDLARVEVLRGPQGTLYGKNVVGGAVNFVSNSPSDEADAQVLVTKGTDRQTEFKGFVNGGLSDNVAGRIAYSSRRREGYAQNDFTGSDLEDLDSALIRGSLLWTPSDTVDVQLSADTYSRRGTAAWIDSATADPRDDPFVTGERSGNNPVDGKEDIDTEGYSLKLNVETGIGTLTSITAYREADFIFEQNTCGMAFDPALVTRDDSGITNATGDGSDLPGCALFDQMVDEQSDQLSQEIRLASNNDGPLNWLVGAFFMHETVDRDESQPFLFDFGIGFWLEGTYNSSQASETDSTALFGTVSYDLTDALNLEVGLRWSKDDKDFSVANSGNPLNDSGAFEDDVTGEPDFSLSGISAQQDESWDEITPSATLKYNSEGGMNYYATYSEGYKSGGWDGANADRPSAVRSYEPEFATNYEIGAKTQWLDDRIRLNVALFYTEYEDLQTQQLVANPPGPPDLVTQNAGEVEASGVELEFTILPAEGLTLHGSYGYLDSEIKSDLCSDGATGAACVGSPDNQKGNVTRRSPENMVNLAANYEWGVPWGTANIRIEYTYTDEYEFDNSNEPLFTNEDFDLWDASVGLVSEDERWEVSVWGKNLADETYRAGLGGFGPWTFNNYAAPRTAGVTVVWNYE